MKKIFFGFCENFARSASKLLLFGCLIAQATALRSVSPFPHKMGFCGVPGFTFRLFSQKINPPMPFPRLCALLYAEEENERRKENFFTVYK